jgi:hypothetical protein
VTSVIVYIIILKHNMQSTRIKFKLWVGKINLNLLKDQNNSILIKQINRVNLIFFKGSK